MTFIAFLTTSNMAVKFKAFNFSSAAYLFNPNPPIIGKAAFTIAAKVPGIAKAYTPIKMKAKTIAKYMIKTTKLLINNGFEIPKYSKLKNIVWTEISYMICLNS